MEFSVLKSVWLVHFHLLGTCSLGWRTNYDYYDLLHQLAAQLENIYA